MKLVYGTYQGQGYLRLLPERSPDDVRSMEARMLANCFPWKEPAESGMISLPCCIESMDLIDRQIGLDRLDCTPSVRGVLLQLKEEKEKQTIVREKAENCYKQIVAPYFLEKKTPDLPQEFCLPYEPYKHQTLALRWMSEMEPFHKTLAILAKMGGGKTRITLSWIEYLIESGKIKKALVIAPLFTLYNAWMTDLRNHTTLVGKVLWSGASGKKKARDLESLFAMQSHVDIINIEGIEPGGIKGNPRRAYLNEQHYDMVVMDESNNIMSPDSVRFRAACEISEDAMYRLILTGTPSPNGVLNLWSQFYFLDRGHTLGTSYGYYRDLYTSVSRYNRHVRLQHADAPERIHQRIKPYALIVENDSIDLPPRTHLLQMIDPTQKQRDLLNEIDREGGALLYEEGGPIEVYCETVLQKMSKMLQWLNGFVYASVNDERRIVKGENPKKEMACSLIMQLIHQNNGGFPSKVIVWGSFVEEIRDTVATLEAACNKEGCGIRVVSAYGSLSSRQIMQNMEDFQKDPLTRIMVAHPQSIGEGTNLQAADYMVYLSIVNNLRTFQQSMERNYRGGQERPVVVYYFVYRRTLEEGILAALRRKEDIQDRIRTGIQNGRSIQDLFVYGDLEKTWKNEER